MYGVEEGSANRETRGGSDRDHEASKANRTGLNPRVLRRT